MPEPHTEIKAQAGDRPADLPYWQKPPLDEIALTVQFEALKELNSLRIVQLRDQFVDQFGGDFEEQPPIMPQFETFGARQIQRGILQIVSNGPKRYWFVSKDAHDLLQIQPDRFVQNWRKVEGIGDYPRFDAIFGTFLNNFERFKAFLVESKLGRLSVNQCELAYFNNFELLADENYLGAIERVFGLGLANQVRLKLKTGSLKSDSGNFAFSFLFGDEAPIARLYVESVLGFVGRTGAPILRLTLIFRGPVTSDKSEDVRKFFLAGRESIVRTFDAMLTDLAHKDYGRVLP